MRGTTRPNKRGDDGALHAIQQAVESRLTPLSSASGADHDYACPFCQKRGEHHRLHVRYSTHKSETGVAVCHGCNYKTRSLLHLIRDLFGGVPRRFEVMVAQAKMLRDVRDILAEDVAAARDAPVPLPDSFERIPERGTGVGRLLLRYLERRGFTYDDVDRFGIGHVTDTDDRAYGYVIFPFYERGTVVYWQGRRVLGDGPKSFNPPRTTKRSYLYGYDQAPDESHYMLVEGPLDTVAASVPRVVYGLGLTNKVLLPEQTRMLAIKQPASVCVCFDGPKDDAEGKSHDDAWAETVETAHALSDALSCPVGYLRLKSGDPASNRRRMSLLYRNRTEWLPGKGDVEARVRAALS